MFTTVAVLVILLGLMVSLARYVRDQSAHQLTRQLLNQLDQLMTQYVEHYGRPPAVSPLLSDASPSDDTLAAASKQNNEQCIEHLKADARRHQRSATEADPFDQLPPSVYDHRTLRDAWGSPLVFMPGQHPLIGLAPSRGGEDQYFFFSAGPDRKYLTRDDNLYSYEGLAAR